MQTDSAVDPLSLRLSLLVRWCATLCGVSWIQTSRGARNPLGSLCTQSKRHPSLCLPLSQSLSLSHIKDTFTHFMLHSRCLGLTVCLASFLFSRSLHSATFNPAKWTPPKTFTSAHPTATSSSTRMWPLGPQDRSVSCLSPFLPSSSS